PSMTSCSLRSTCPRKRSGARSSSTCPSGDSVLKGKEWSPVACHGSPKAVSATFFFRAIKHTPWGALRVLPRSEAIASDQSQNPESQSRSGKKSGLTVFSPVRMLQNGSTTRARQVLSIGTPMPLHRERVVSHHSVPSRIDGFFDAQDVDQAAHQDGNLPRSLRFDPVADLVPLDVPALVLSRDGQHAPRTARDQGQAFRRPELAT